MQNSVYSCIYDSFIFIPRVDLSTIKKKIQVVEKIKLATLLIFSDTYKTKQFCFQK